MKDTLRGRSDVETKKKNRDFFLSDHLKDQVLKYKKKKLKKSEKITQNQYLATLYFHNPRPLIFMFFMFFFELHYVKTY